MPKTIQDVIQAHDALVNLIQNDKEQKYSIPKGARLKLAKNLNSCIPVVEQFSKVHNALVATYGSKQKDGSLNVTDAEKMKSFTLERQNELNALTDIQEWEVIGFSEFPEQVSVDLIALCIRTGMVDVNS